MQRRQMHLHLVVLLSLYLLLSLRNESFLTDYTYIGRGKGCSGRVGVDVEGKLSALDRVGEGLAEAEVNLLRSHEAALGGVSFVRDVCISHHHPKAAHAR